MTGNVETAAVEQVDGLKRIAAEKAVESIKHGMIVGLGTGSTSRLAVEAIGRKQREEGLRITGIPTSEATAVQAKSLGIALTSFESVETLDLTIDGADAVEPHDLTLIKGLGGALLREKIVASASRQMIVIVDEMKLAGALGSRTPVPVEVVQFGWQATRRKLQDLGCRPELRVRNDNQPFITDGGNHIIDCFFGPIIDAMKLQSEMINITGVVETGLFIGIASQVIVARSEGIEVLTRAS